MMHEELRMPMNAIFIFITYKHQNHDNKAQIEAYGHNCWVKFSDERVMDSTASQSVTRKNLNLLTIIICSDRRSEGGVRRK